MTERDKKRIVYIAGMIGYMNDKRNWDDVYVEEEVKVIDDMLSSIINKIATDNAEFRKLYKEVLEGVYEVNCYKNHEVIEKKRRMLKSRTKVDRESLYTVAEHSMEMCKECTRKKSKCALRVALLKCAIPQVNDGNGKCEFNWRDE